MSPRGEMPLQKFTMKLDQRTDRGRTTTDTHPQWCPGTDRYLDDSGRKRGLRSNTESQTLAIREEVVDGRPYVIEEYPHTGGVERGRIEGQERHS